MNQESKQSENTSFQDDKNPIEVQKIIAQRIKELIAITEDCKKSIYHLAELNNWDKSIIQAHFEEIEVS